jgi:predicted DNA binding CopG/RHH family protein
MKKDIRQLKIQVSPQLLMMIKLQAMNEGKSVKVWLTEIIKKSITVPDFTVIENQIRNGEY